MNDSTVAVFEDESEASLRQEAWPQVLTDNPSGGRSPSSAAITSRDGALGCGARDAGGVVPTLEGGVGLGSV